ncbi:MAG: hypothetical protein ACE5ID_06400, partial [Acidobacteriota bacterium]
MAVRSLLLELAAVPAPSGDEAPLRRLIMEKIRQQEGHETLEVDGLGNLRVDTGLLGRGLPGSWLFLLPMDDPTFAVSGRLPRGWLQVVSLARPPLSPSFIRHVAGSEVWVMTAGGAVPGLFALPSIHLQGGRPSFPPAASTVHLVVDVGAEPGEEGVQQPAAPRLLDRVVPRVEPVVRADGSVVGLGVGRRSAAAAAILAAGGG